MSRLRINSWYDARVLVVGDVMLDRYVRGSVTRVSPEAPIPVLHCESETEMPGGAANVARNITALGGKAVILGCVGADSSGERLRELLESDFRMTVDLTTVDGGATIEKWRFGTGRQQMLRVDREVGNLEDPENLRALYSSYLPSADIVVLSDYGKGALPAPLIKEFITLAAARGIPVIADPKGGNCQVYDGAMVITPNRPEAEAMTGISGHCDQSAVSAASRLLDRMPNTTAVLITRGSKGMTLALRDHAPLHIRARAQAIFDVSGAGDTVCAAIAMCLASGHALADAARIANDAAGLVVALPGTATVTRAMLEREQQMGQILQSENKIVSLAAIIEQAEGWRKKGLRIGFTNGCFDLIHPGHIALLSQARASCDRLIVGLNSDASVRRLKGTKRPVQDELSRALMLAALSSVDRIIIFEQDTPLALVVGVKPDVLIKGKGYKLEDVVGGDIVKSRGGEVVLVDEFGNHSTTETIARLVSAAVATA